VAEQSLPDGAAAAAVVASGIGAAVLGLLTTGAELSPGLKSALTLSQSVGPLSGKTVFATGAYFASWAALHALWKGTDVNFTRKAAIAGMLIVAGVLLTFPLVFQALAP
jgi:hypothetical protein